MKFWVWGSGIVAIHRLIYQNFKFSFFLKLLSGKDLRFLSVSGKIRKFYENFT